LKLRLDDGLWYYPAVEGLGKFKTKSENGKWYVSVPQGEGAPVRVKLEDGHWYDAFWLAEVGGPTGAPYPGDDIYPADDLYPGDF
jgi:hypothetical protein